MRTPLPFIPLFEKFIRDSETGRRTKKNGERIKPQSVDNYRYCLRLLKQFSEVKMFDLKLFSIKGNNKKEHAVLKKYWNNFYKKFTDYLYNDLGYYDNYVGQTIKQVRTFFNWLVNDQGISCGSYFRNFYVRKDEIPIHPLTVEQLHFLIHDRVFEETLSSAQKQAKDCFILGCTVGLRYSDLSKLTFRNLLHANGTIYMVVKAQKTGTDTMVRLPEYVLSIFSNYRKNRRRLLPYTSLFRFNKNLKVICEKAGWTWEVPKMRQSRGATKEIKLTKCNKPFRFCDQVSSHTMRRTSITTMLCSAIPEYVVRQISGHSESSESFFRYVKLAQGMMDLEIEKCIKSCLKRR